MTLPEVPSEITLRPYERNKNVLPKNLEEYFAYLEDWRRSWHGASMCYEYHFWRHQVRDVTGFELAKLIVKDIEVYRDHGINGIIEDGSQRCFYPTGYHFYTYARKLFDISLSEEDIAKDYFSTAFGEDWRSFYNYLDRLREAIDYRYLSKMEKTPFYSPENVSRLAKVPEILAEGRELIAKHYNSDYRLRTVSVRLLERHARHIELLWAALSKRAVGKDEEALELYEKWRVESGKDETEIGAYFDHTIFARHTRALFNKKSDFAVESDNGGDVNDEIASV